MCIHAWLSQVLLWWSALVWNVTACDAGFVSHMSLSHSFELIRAVTTAQSNPHTSASVTNLSDAAAAGKQQLCVCAVGGHQ